MSGTLNELARSLGARFGHFLRVGRSNQRIRRHLPRNSWVSAISQQITDHVAETCRHIREEAP
jgi:hypothetical protein